MASERNQVSAPVPVLMNRSAGRRASSRRAEIEATFAAAGIRVIITEAAPEEMTRTLRDLRQRGASLVAVAGGDGTISTAANVLRGAATTLVPIPLGTRNHFATRYGIGTIEAAARALRSGTIAMVPVGVVNGRAFVNNASCGFHPHVVRHRDRLRPWIMKWPATLIAALRVLIARPLMDVELSVNGRAIERRTAAVWVGIGQNSLRLPVPGDVVMPGDVLEVLIPRTIGRLRLLIAAIRVYRRLQAWRSVSDPLVENFHLRRFELSANDAIDIALDGEEMRMQGRLTFQYQPGALRIVCLICPAP